MPEYREVTAHYVHVQMCLEKLKETNSTTVLNIWADPSLKAHEADLSPTKCVIRLTRSMDVTRGSKSSKVSLFPQILPQDKPISSLVFRDVSMTPRAVRLDFSVMHLQLAFLMHTSVQFFSQSLWDEVKATTQKKRKFRVRMAFEFHTHVLAFVSLDNLFQPFWSLSATGLPEGHVDAYKDLAGFLKRLVRWMDNRRRKKRLGLASEIIRKGEKGANVFGGVGKYTVLELFFMGGLSPFLTERDVFEDPSRTARLILALWCYQHHSIVNIAGLIRPCMVDLVIAPYKKQREGFYQKWIHVYSTDKVKVPMRMYNQLVDIEAVLSGDESKVLYDPYEPMFMNDVWKVLRDSDDVPLATVQTLQALGNLAFGRDKWLSLGGRATSGSDDLTLYFCRRETPSTVNIAQLDSLIAPDPHRQWKIRTVYAHKSPVSSISTFWSIVPAFSKRFSRPGYGESRSYEDFYLASSLDREHELYRHIIWHTRKVGIGPLEYRGHAFSVLTKNRKRLVSAVETERKSVLAAYAARAVNKKRKCNPLSLRQAPSTPTRARTPGLSFSSSPVRSSSPLPLTPIKPRPYWTHNKELTKMSEIDPSALQARAQSREPGQAGPLQAKPSRALLVLAVGPGWAQGPAQNSAHGKAAA
ncbi:hypothetical protein DFP72DRAFT_1074556 [Ephemerocybe angulata]|uniref:Uncharacterized protein n=1 Tax=Ephemerocybe angulata TaxID=980116 RepID=A0A8H6M1J9_9AGAR|nr:hypothetical protein DFP72DRAFT_1074556 [Tulosesus angulatus]